LKLIISAANVHQGGGRTLLLALLAAARGPTIALADSRLVLPKDLPGNIQLTLVEPTLAARFQAERRLPSLCAEGDVLIAFGNLPPLFPNPAKVFVYIQNRYLTSARSLAGLPLRARMRILVERFWLRRFLRDATILVQTPSMVTEVKSGLGRDAVLAPFAPQGESPIPKGPKEYDYIYVASGEPHKNHRRLVEAWEMLASEGHYPSLRTTLDSSREGELCGWIEEQRQSRSLKITNLHVAPDEMASAYATSSSLIYPSLFESFGLPLIEAERAGLSIVAAERDYVRDVVAPGETFDPESAVSIARAIKRHMQLNSEGNAVPSAETFLERLTRPA